MFSLLPGLFLGIPSNAQVQTAIDSSSIRIGEEIVYRITVDTDTTDIVVFPEGQTFLPLEVIESYKVDTTFEKAKYTLIKKYGLTQFDSGKYTIPGQKVFINERTFVTDSLLVEVRDVPVDTAKQKMFDIKPAISVESPPPDFKKLLYWLLPLLVLGAVVLFLLRRKKKRDEARKELPPYEEAMLALNELDNSNLLKENKSKAFYSQLTEIVKRYLDREVDEAALESTSDELITRLHMHKDAGHFDFDEETIARLDRILKRADLVKFAKMQLEAEQASEDRISIEQIINSTKEAIPEPTEEELLMDAEYALAQLKKRRNRRIIIGVTAGCVTLLVVGIILVSTYGFTYLKDNLIGHPTKELAEGKWVRSEYGIPAVIVETPKVLTRTELPLPAELQQVVTQSETFSYGSLLGNLHIMVNTMRINEQAEINLEEALEGGIRSLEENGATNLVVKKEDFSTNEGIEGRKAYGTFNAVLPSGQQLQKKQHYQIVLFAQKGALQQLVLSYSDDDRYAEDVANRIINSVEIELMKKQ